MDYCQMSHVIDVVLSLALCFVAIVTAFNIAHLLKNVPAKSPVIDKRTGHNIECMCNFCTAKRSYLEGINHE